MACVEHDEAPHAEKELKLSARALSISSNCTSVLDSIPVEADVASRSEKGILSKCQTDSEDNIRSHGAVCIDREIKRQSPPPSSTLKREETISTGAVKQGHGSALLTQQQLHSQQQRSHHQQAPQKQAQQQQDQPQQQRQAQQQHYSSAPPISYDGYYYPSGGGNGSVGYAIPMQQRGVYQQTVPYGYNAGYPVIQSQPWPVQQAVIFSSSPNEPGGLVGSSAQWSTTALVGSPPYVQPSHFAGAPEIPSSGDVGGLILHGEMPNEPRAVPHPGPPIQMVADGHGPDGCNLFIFHIPNEMSNLDLFNFFSPFGNVISARIMVDNETGRSRGFGFVSYDNSRSASEAIAQMNGLQIGHKRLKVQYKKDKGCGEEGYGPPETFYGGRGGKGRNHPKHSRGARGKGARGQIGITKTAVENGVRLPSEHIGKDFRDELAGEIGDLHFGEESEDEDATKGPSLP